MKIDEVKDGHAAESLDKLRNYHDESSAIDAIFVLGRIKQNDHLAQAIASNLSAQSIRALERFQQEKRHEDLGFTTFDQFLSDSPYSPMTKRQYYDRVGLIRGHGDEIYDLLTSVGISVRSQRLLGKGELSIKGDKLLVGDKEIEVANTGIIKDVLNELFEDKRSLKAENEKLTKKVTTQKDQIEKGREEFDELRRNIDAAEQGAPYERALMATVKALITLTSEAKSLSDADKAERAGADLETLTGQLFQLQDALGVKTAIRYRGTGQPVDLKPLEEMTEEEKKATFFDRHPAVLKDDDDFGDENE